MNFLGRGRIDGFAVGEKHLLKILLLLLFVLLSARG